MQLRQAELSRQSERTKAQSREAADRVAAADRRLGGIDIERGAAVERQTRLAARRDQVAAELGDLQERSAALGRKLDALAADLAARQTALEAKRAEAAAADQALADLGESLSAARESRGAVASRRKVLQDLEARREGVGAGVRQVLRDRDSTFPFVRGLVADLLRVDVEHATAIEAALDGRDQWLVIEAGTTPRDLAAAVNLMAHLPERVNLLRPSCSRGRVLIDWAAALSTATTRRPGIRLARDLVAFEPGDAGIADALLGDTLVVASLSDAFALHGLAAPGFRFVTAAGETVEADGTLRAGPLGPTMGLLSRRSELAATGYALAEIDRQIASLQNRIRLGGERSKLIAAEAAGLRERIYELNAATVEASSRRSAAEDRADALRRERPAVESEWNDLAAKLERLSAEAATLLERKGVARRRAARARRAAGRVGRATARLVGRVGRGERGVDGGAGGGGAGAGTTDRRPARRGTSRRPRGRTCEADRADRGEFGRFASGP